MTQLFSYVVILNFTIFPTKNSGLKFIYSENATQYYEIFTLLLIGTT